jgi:prepilin-type N-terminal cleavage/methylation domain-containing protein
MKKNEEGFSVVEVLIVLVVIGLISATGWYVWQNHKSNTKPQSTNQTSITSEATLTTKNSTIDSMLKGVDYQLLDSTPGSACSDDRNVCYSGDTVFLKMNYPVPDTIKKVATNLGKDEWLLDDGRPADSFLNSDIIATSNSNPNEIPDKNLIFNEAGADKNYGYWGYFNLGLFGTQLTMYRGDEGAYFFAFSKEDVQANEPYYIMQSELSVDDSYDYGKSLSNIDDNSYILSITLGKK